MGALAVSRYSPIPTHLSDEQIVIMHRSSDQMMVVPQRHYDRYQKTKYRNWRLYGQSKLIEVPLTISTYLHNRRWAQSDR